MLATQSQLKTSVERGHLGLLFEIFFGYAMADDACIQRFS
jgi:hypothetical protein